MYCVLTLVGRTRAKVSCTPRPSPARNVPRRHSAHAAGAGGQAHSQGGAAATAPVQRAGVSRPRRRLQASQPLTRNPICVLHLERRTVRPSAYVPLEGDGFAPSFEALWTQHIDFGTSRSHKKLLGKKAEKMEWQARLGAKQSSAAASTAASSSSAEATDARRESAGKKGKKRPRSADASDRSLADTSLQQRPLPDPQRQPAAAAASDAAQAAAAATAAGAAGAKAQKRCDGGSSGGSNGTLANKGRFSGTLAARLLGSG